jgi:nucleotide-binding universal stress UspA family protein
MAYARSLGSCKAKDRNIGIKTEVIAGHPANQIVRYAKENNSDMIVICRMGKSKIENWLLGSVSKGCDLCALHGYNCKIA